MTPSPDTDAAFEAALPEPALTRRTRPHNAFDREDVSFLREHFPDGKDVDLFTRDQMRAIWAARGKADAMVCDDIADKIGMHVATVSRAVKDKYIQTPVGVLRDARDTGGTGYSVGNVVTLTPAVGDTLGVVITTTVATVSSGAITAITTPPATVRLKANDLIPRLPRGRRLF